MSQRLNKTDSHGNAASPSGSRDNTATTSTAYHDPTSTMSSSNSPYPDLSPSANFVSADASSQLLFPADHESAASEAATSAPPSNSSASASQTSDSGLGAEPLGFTSETDGLADRLFRSKPKGPVAAIFIHAGAGFHSTSNEHVHLEACSDAARIAMKFLKAGGTAVDAVEAAIKCLEDREITNAGFGSNLSIDGIVEADATIVDHLGRSGACGAVPMVKNPISLARLILDQSNVPLSLRRIPPNILVGSGARRFAEEHGMRILSNDELISRSARDRYCRWRQDLIRAEKAAVRHNQQAASAAAQDPPVVLDQTKEHGRETLQRRSRGPTAAPGTQALAAQGYASLSDVQATGVVGSSTGSRLASFSSSLWQGRLSTPHPKRPRGSDAGVGGSGSPEDEEAKRCRRSESSGDGSSYEASFNTFPSIAKTMLAGLSTADVAPSHTDAYAIPTAYDTRLEDARTNYLCADCGLTNTPLREDPLCCKDCGGRVVSEDTADEAEDVYKDIGLNDNDTDIITDTVGAIAIDLRGNIAAGSSSGGIGMKHSGRIGPAALVGIGTAVMPVDPKDHKGTCVAAVTSGTGEHMATTMASHTCAERLYYNMRRAEGGSQDTEYDDDTLMKSFVVDDFMDHPGVKNQISGGAIGVMAAKRTNKAIYFYFAHNTDSFALASMTSNEQDPLVVMSRLGTREHVARGGRKIKGGH